MKKILFCSRALSFGLACSLALSPLLPSRADGVDLSDMSFDELVALRDQIDMAIWSSAEWQEVEVPEGIYQVGKDIPAGHWSIRPIDQYYMNIYYFDILDSIGKGPGPGAKLFIQDISKSGTDGFGGIVLEYTDLDMVDGMYFYCSGPVVFSPYAGKHTLNFR